MLNAPPSWEQNQWQHPEALFVAGSLAGPEVVSCLESRMMTLGGVEVGLPELINVVGWERRQSRSPAAYEALDWPVTEARLSMHVNAAEPSGPLVSDGEAPSFVSFYVAGACFFCLTRQQGGGQLNQGVIVPPPGWPRSHQLRPDHRRRRRGGG